MQIRILLARTNQTIEEKQESPNWLPQWQSQKWTGGLPIAGTTIPQKPWAPQKRRQRKMPGNLRRAVAEGRVVGNGMRYIDGEWIVTSRNPK